MIEFAEAERMLREITTNTGTMGREAPVWKRPLGAQWSVKLPSGERVILTSSVGKGFRKIGIPSGWFEGRNVPRTAARLRRACLAAAGHPSPVVVNDAVRTGV